MEFVPVLLIFMFLFKSFLSENFNFSENYQETLNDLKKNGLKDTIFCESVLLPTEDTLKKSLQSTFVNFKSDSILKGSLRMDNCCRFFHKCDAKMRAELNLTTMSSLWNCECINSFYICLDNINTTTSNKFALIHSINTTECYQYDYPIIQCERYQEYSNIQTFLLLKFYNSDQLEKYFKRCIIYKLDRNRGKILQNFDVPFNTQTTVSTNDGSILSDKVANAIEKVTQLAKIISFDSVQEIIIHIFNILRAIRDLGCNISDLIKVIKKERNHVWFSDQSEANRKMNEQKWNALLMAIENLIQVLCNNTAIIDQMPNDASSISVKPITSTVANNAQSNPLTIYGGVHYHGGVQVHYHYSKTDTPPTDADESN